jgi:hypothetical protein
MNRAEETTGTFLGDYTEAFVATAEKSRSQLAEAVLAWIDRHNGELSGLRDRLADPEVQRYLEAGLARLQAVDGVDAADRMQALIDLADLHAMLKVTDDGKEPGLLVEVSPSRTPAQDEIIASYPLFIGAEGTASAAMPWHSEVPEQPGDSSQRLVRHQVYVFRLRRQLAVGVTDAVTRRLTQEVEKFYHQLRQDLEDALSAIPGPADLRRMFPPEPPEPAGAADEQFDPSGSPIRELLREWARRPRHAA